MLSDILLYIRWRWQKFLFDIDSIWAEYSDDGYRYPFDAGICDVCGEDTGDECSTCARCKRYMKNDRGVQP